MGHPDFRALCLEDPAAAGYFVVLVEDGGLAGGDGALGLVEDGFDGVGRRLTRRVAGAGSWRWRILMVTRMGSVGSGMETQLRRLAVRRVESS